MMESNFTLCKKNICNYYLKQFCRAVATLLAAAGPLSSLLEIRSERTNGRWGRRCERARRRPGEWKMECLVL